MIPIVILLFMIGASVQGAGITYEFSGGRFGDNLAAYAHAKWLSYKTGIPLYYRPFKYSETLCMHQAEKHLEEYVGTFNAQITLSNKSLAMDPSSNSLYVVPYFSESEYEFRYPWTKDWIYLRVDWDDQQFMQILKNMIKPAVPITINGALSTQDRVRVAVHVRKGGGFDFPLLSDAQEIDPTIPYADYYAGLRFPPESFYVAQIKRIANILNTDRLYIYIFTDDQHPEEIAHRFKDALPALKNSVFDYRKDVNGHDMNVLDDFFSLTSFECIIHPQSHFSIMASKLGRPKIEICPINFHWQSNKHVLDSVSIMIRESVSLAKDRLKQAVIK